MATLITNNTAGNILIQTGTGVPNHVAPKGSQFTDITTANLYINKDGITNWVLNVDASNSGATSNIYSFNSFSSTTIGQTFVSTNIANDTITFSGIGLNIITDDTNNILTFSSSTDTDTYVTGGTYNPSTGIATFTNNSGSGFDVTGITDNYWTSGSTGNYSIKAKNDSGLDATGNYAVAEGEGTLASGISSHAEGGTTISSGQYSHAEGSYSLASGNQSHAEGFSTSATGITAHAEGNYTIAGGNYSHAEGNFTKAYGNQSHAEGNYTIASGNSSHAEGNYTIANGNSSHAEGESTIASGDYSHAGGDNSVASGTTSFVHSSNSFTNSDYSAILGGYNNIIPYGIINSIILGGDSITATTSGTTFVEGLNIKNTQNDNSITKLLTVDNTGLVKYRDASSIIVSDTYVTGGTYNGGTATFTNNTGGTFNVNGFYTGATDVYVTGLTFNPSNYDLTISRNDNISFTENLAILSSDMVVTGGTYNSSTGIATFTNNSGGTFNVNGFLTGMTDTYVTGLTYSNNLITLKQNAGQPNLSILIDSMSGLTINGGFSANTISATTYYNLPTDIRVTGGTYSNGTTTFTNNTGGTFNVTGYYTGATDVYTTGATYNNNTFTHINNTGGTYNVSFNSVTGLTVNGGLSATTISATTYYNLPITTDVFVTGGTYSNGTTVFRNNTGGTFNVTGYYTGATDVYITGATYSSNVFTYRNNTGGTFNVLFNSVTGLTVDGVLSATTISGDTIYANNFPQLPLIDNETIDYYVSSGDTFIRLKESVAAPSGGTRTFVGNVNITSGLSASTISATTYYNLPNDIRVTGGTYNNGTILFTNNTGGTFNVTGLYSGATDVYTTGATYNNNTFIYRNNTGGTFDVSFNSVTGLTIDGILSATTYLNLPSITGLYLPLSGGTVTGGTIFTDGITANTLNVTGLTTTKGVTSTGGITFKQVTINSSYTANTSDYMIDVSGGTFTVALPSAVGIQGRLLVIKNNGGGAVTVDPYGSETIDDKPFVILGETNVVQLVSNGSNWVAISYNISTVNSSTGVFEFTGLTKVSSNTFNVGEVKGWVVDDTTNPLSPQLYYVYYSGGVHTDSYVTTANETFVYLTSGGTISQQPTPLTSTQRRLNIFLGKLGHPDKTTINLVFSQPDFVLSPLSQLRDMFTPINLINGGVYPSANTGLTINTSAGYIYGLGINFASDTLNPNSLYIPSTNPLTFQYRTQTGGTITDRTNIDPLNYDLNGVITPIGGTKATNQRIYLLQNGSFRVQYGQTEYSNFADAIQGLQTETFTEFPNFVNNAVLIGILTLLSSATDLTDTSKAKFFFASKFGETVGATGGVSTTTLQQAYNNSVNPEIITNSIEGALSIKNGTGNADNVTRLLEGQTGANGVTSFIRADGYISGTTFQSNGFIANTNGLTATTVSATTYYNLPTSLDIYVTGGTYSNSTGITTFRNNTGGTFNVTGFFKTSDDIYTTGATYNNNNTFTYTNNTGGTFNVSFNNVTGLTVNGVLSATTYYNLPDAEVDTKIFGYRVNSATQKAYKTTQTIVGSTMSTGTINGESIYCQKFYAQPNESINEIVFRIMTAGAGGLGLAQARILIYRSKLNANNEIIGGDLELDTNVNISTLSTGLKVVTGLNHTLSNNTYKNVWFMCIRNYQSGSLSLKFYTTADIVSKLYDISASSTATERDLGWYFSCLYTSATPASMPVSASTSPSTTAVASTSGLVAIGYSNY